MDNDYLDLPGLVVSFDSLELPRSRALADVLASGRLAYVQLIECRRETQDNDQIRESLIFDVEVERPQRCVHAIRRKERVAVSFGCADNWYPEVVALEIRLSSCASRKSEGRRISSQSVFV